MLSARICYLALESLLICVCATHPRSSGSYHRSFSHHFANDDLDASNLDLTVLLEGERGAIHHRHHHYRRHHDVDFQLSEPVEWKPVQSTLQETGLACAGHFTPYSECQKTCYRWREYIVDSPAQDGGEPCIHNNGFIERQTCSDGDCPMEELPPTGDLPNEEKQATRMHHLAVDVALPFALAIVLSMCVGEVVHHVPWLRAIPHSLITILVAGSMGFMLRAHEDRFGADTFSPVCTGVMNLVLLPIIIFQAGWSMRHKDFANNFLYICIFAVLGTAISTVLIGSMIWFTGSWGWHVITGAREAFAVASLISATDPVAMLSAFAMKKVEPNLNIMVLGESTINDAVAIALFNMLNIDEPTAYWFFPSAAMQTFKLLVCSIFIGFLMGALLVMLFRAVKQVAQGPHSGEVERGTSFETLYVMGSAYLINAVAECWHMSGIIACLFGGITMGIYLRAHMSAQAEENTTYYIGTASETADLTVFIMVGVTTALIKSSRGFRFGAFLLLFCLVGRAITVFTCGGICNVLHKARFGGALMEFLSIPKLVMMWHAGLRGGIALTLALQLNDWAEHKAVLITGTFIVIFCLMVMMGSTIDAMLNMCNIEQGCITEAVSYKDLHLAALEVKGLGSSFHAMVLHPLLVGDAAIQKRLQVV
eukprot:gnl/MRDRNA2_/MRDRNA2_90503_c0_seq1.p1 gnl/MRDRNA2_/MRDRNA2_90503_c0~~gnl/MRDRNA2_/MRDRNA2_90503_c0_seq1.p1  ORF type:complete len:651 (-),score=80.07 gnl/MRDRNA2_/MRDRNA2_90503_c0_seq1:167-2119(-)